MYEKHLFFMKARLKDQRDMKCVKDTWASHKIAKHIEWWTQTDGCHKSLHFQAHFCLQFFLVSQFIRQVSHGVSGNLLILLWKQRDFRYNTICYTMNTSTCEISVTDISSPQIPFNSYLSLYFCVLTRAIDCYSKILSVNTKQSSLSCNCNRGQLEWGNCR